MEPLRQGVRAFLALLALASGLFALPSLAALPGLEPSPAAAAVAALKEPLPAEAFLEAALGFSGAEGAALEAGRGRAEALIAKASALPARDPGRKAEELLALLHREVLRRYDERQTRLDELLATGSYNCVSSAVLYGLLARCAGLDFRAVQTPDHVLIRVLPGAGGYDVETTSPYGFDPGSRKEFSDSFGRVTGYTYVPPGHYGSRRELSDKGLLALILYNRSAYATERGRYVEALQPAVDAHTLRGDAESAERLLLSCLNVASSCGMGGRYEEGLEFLRQAARRLPPDPRLARLREDLLHNWVVSLVEARRFEQAQELADARRADGELPEPEWRSLAVTIWQMRAQEASRRDLAEAASLLRQAMENLGAEPRLVAAFEVYVHNRAAGLANDGRPQEALAVLREALQALPGSPRLREDEARLAGQLGGRR